MYVIYIIYFLIFFFAENAAKKNRSKEIFLAALYMLYTLYFRNKIIYI